MHPNPASETGDTQAPQTLNYEAMGLYVHVPFCATTCQFCAFVQKKPDREGIRRFLEAVRHEWAYYRPWLSQEIDTIFWGGGTPGLLLPGDLEELGECCLEGLSTEKIVEWTVEMAPATVTPAKLQILKSIGVTRISMGVQTFSDATLKIMDRYHSVSQIHRAWEWIRAADFHSTNLDLIIAYPGQTRDELLADLRQAVALQPDHLSTYCLTFEEDTPLYAKLMQGIYKIDRDAEADLYREAWQYLESEGFQQYEVSNFSREGHTCRHNCNTWRMQQWIGLGPSAASQHGGKRWTHSHDLDKWQLGCLQQQPAYADFSELESLSLLADCLVFGLRMNEGVDLAALQQRFNPLTLSPWEGLFVNLRNEGLALQHESHLRLTLEGRLLADAIGVEILSCI
jgi:oxygen-independent coproporphyrinogen III oxidase